MVIHACRHVDTSFKLSTQCKQTAACLRTQGSTFVHRDVFTSNTAASPIPNSQLLFSPRAGTIACPLTGAMIITCADGSCLGSWKHEVEVVFHHSRTSQDTNLSCITHTSSQPTAGIPLGHSDLPTNPICVICLNMFVFLFIQHTINKFPNHPSYPSLSNACIACQLISTWNDDNAI